MMQNVGLMTPTYDRQLISGLKIETCERCAWFTEFFELHSMADMEDVGSWVVAVLKHARYAHPEIVAERRVDNGEM